MKKIAGVLFIGCALALGAFVAYKMLRIRRPGVLKMSPESSAQKVNESTFIATQLLLPNGAIDTTTISSETIYLTETATGAFVPVQISCDVQAGQIRLRPQTPLKLNTTYNFAITDGLKDRSGTSFMPYNATFTTGQVSGVPLAQVQFEKQRLPFTDGRHSTLTIGPDGKLYALSVDGIIKRFGILPDGSLTQPELLYSLQDAYGSRTPRLAIGLSFDPVSTSQNLIAWVTHSSYSFDDGPDWDGKLTRLSGPQLQQVQDVLVNLPRSLKDHLTNSIAFGHDGALYFSQGSTTAMGKGDKRWAYREEHLLSGTILRLDTKYLGRLPLDVKTPDAGGRYNPLAPNAPLTIWATGLRNAYDLLWHSNGQLYVPTNGSASGGNTPASKNGAKRLDGSTYTGQTVPSLENVGQTQKDFLFRVVKGGYYGHPNPVRGEFVLNGGNPTGNADPAEVKAYPEGIKPDPNWRGFAYDFQNHKSPNGIIEYSNDVFGGVLKGKIIVARYTTGDLIVLTPGGPALDIVSSAEGNAIKGFNELSLPLDLIEDPRTGNIYVSEYGTGGITILRPMEKKSNSPTVPVLISKQ